MKDWFDRIEPGLGEIISGDNNARPPAFMASAAISLKRIADHLDKQPSTDDTGEAALKIDRYLIDECRGPTGVWKIPSDVSLQIINALAGAGFKVVRK